MSNEEQTQVFRGDDLPPEMAIAENGGLPKQKKADAPVDSRSLRDQDNGPASTRHLQDARDGQSDVRRLDDAQDELADLRRLHDADGDAHTNTLNDGSGPVIDTGHGHGDGPSDVRQLHDADGLADARHSHDADGPSDQRRMEDAQGLSDTRQMHDHWADVPPSGEPGPVTLNQFGEPVDADEAAEEAIVAEAEAVSEAQMSDPDLTFSVDDDATPWALSIHLEERIASLSVTTTKVNEQLDGLEESIRRLAKRIGK